MPDLSRPRPTEPRLRPLEPLPSEAASILEGVTGVVDRAPLNIFSTLAHRPDLLKPFLALGSRLLVRGRIPAREREVVILRIGADAASRYEFGQHRLAGRRAGLSDEEITRLAGTIDRRDWSEDDRALIALADDLSRNDVVSDETWRALTGRWDEGEMVELLLLAGYYRMVSGFLNSAGVQLDEGVPGWPGDDTA